MIAPGLMISKFLLVSVIAVGLADAGPANDWSKPCFHGECAYELSDSTSGSRNAGTLKLFGSSKSISDITPAAGWVILECDPHSLVQDIRLVCKTDEKSESGCVHLFEHGGAADKIVRLTEGCGAGPFGRIVDVQVAGDQSIPAHAEHHITRRDGIAPQVHTIRVDTNFAAINEQKTGPVYFAFQGGNLPGLAEAANFNPPNQLNDATAAGWFEDWVNKFKTTAQDLLNKTQEVIDNLTTIRFEEKKTLDLYKFDAPIKEIYSYHAKCDNIFNTTKQSTFEASLEIKAGGEGSLTATVGVIAAGIVSRAEVTEFGAFIKLSAQLKLQLLLRASMSGTVESERKELFRRGIPPLEIPGFISLGPSFVIEGKAKGSFEVIFDAELGLDWKNGDLEFWFPEKVSKPDAEANAPEDTPLKITATPSVSGKATVAVSVIPQVQLGLKVWKASAEVYLAATGTATVSLEGKVSTQLKRREEAAFWGEMYPQEEKDLAHVALPYGLATRSLAVREAIKATWCLRFLLGVSIDGGVDGKFFGIWSGRKELDPFFTKEWEVLKLGTQCAAAGLRSLPKLGSSRLFKRDTPPKCPVGPAGKEEALADETVKASDIKPVS